MSLATALSTEFLAPLVTTMLSIEETLGKCPKLYFSKRIIKTEGQNFGWKRIEMAVLMIDPPNLWGIRPILAYNYAILYNPRARQTSAPQPTQIQKYLIFSQESGGEEAL